jgi:formate dehydrogenase subunit beta
MLSYTEKIREIAGRLLQSGAVEMVIGFRAGTVPMMNGTATAASTWPTT